MSDSGPLGPAVHAQSNLNEEDEMMTASRRVRVVVVCLAFMLLGTTAMGQTNERGIDPANFDTTCSPCTDFYQYANGAWLANNPVPPDQSRWSVWNEIRERNYKILHEILENAAATGGEPGTTNEIVGDFYATAIDSTGAEAQGVDPIRPDLQRIDAIANRADLQALITAYHGERLRAVFDVDVYQDFKNSEIYRIYVSQGGLGLPDRDYYTRDDDESKELREQYVAHIAKMFELLGESQGDAEAAAQNVMSIETRLAKASLTNVEARDPENQYKLTTLAQATDLTPNFSWSAYFAGLGVASVQEFSLAQPEFFKEVNQLLAEVPLDQWKQYLRWGLVHAAAPYLSSPFVNENFEFFGKTLHGTAELQPRWKRFLNMANWYVGEPIGKLYVETAFPPESKVRALELVENLRSALHDRILKLDWMSDATRAKALEKVATFTPKIGYPDKWRDYSTLHLQRDSYFANVRRVRAFAIRYDLNKLGKPLDRTEWGMPPQIVNAYYNPLMNEVVFPAAILQPPFFDASIDDPVNYGAIGSVIGHELMHGFDDEGSKFDEKGNYNDWWTAEDRSQFEARTAKLVEQYDGYVAVDTLHVNGKLTLGENIADLGGVIISYAALQKALEGKPKEKIDGFTPEQRFFLSWAQAWRANMRPEALKVQVNTDPHSPSRFRANGPLSDLIEFREAFGCQDGDPMVRNGDQRVVIW